MLGVAAEEVAASTTCLWAWPLCMLCQGRPDGQLRTVEPVCLTASRTSCHPHRTSVQNSLTMSKCRPDPSPRPRVGQRPCSPPNVYTVYRGHRSAATVTGFLSPRTFVTSCLPGVLPHTPASDACPRTAGQAPVSRRQERAPVHPLLALTLP